MRIMRFLWRCMLVGLLLLILAGGGLWSYRLLNPPEQHKNIHIALMTSLPIVWGADASMQTIVAGESESAPIFQYWQERYSLQTVDNFDGLATSPTDIVILAQPRVMAPQDLVAFDSWLRAGGKALILTDPLLLWPSPLSLTDSRRPLATGLLSPLLNHWQLELLAPPEPSVDIETDEDIEENGHLKPYRLKGLDILSAEVGYFQKREPKQQDAPPADIPNADNIKNQNICQIETPGHVADCKIGKGRALLIADADFLHEATWIGDPAYETKGTNNAILLIDRLIADLYDMKDAIE